MLWGEGGIKANTQEMQSLMHAFLDVGYPPLTMQIFMAIIPQKKRLKSICTIKYCPRRHHFDYKMWYQKTQQQRCLYKTL